MSDTKRALIEIVSSQRNETYEAKVDRLLARIRDADDAVIEAMDMAYRTPQYAGVGEQRAKLRAALAAAMRQIANGGK